MNFPWIQYPKPEEWKRTIPLGWEKIKKNDLVFSTFLLFYFFFRLLFQDQMENFSHERKEEVENLFQKNLLIICLNEFTVWVLLFSLYFPALTFAYSIFHLLLLLLIFFNILFCYSMLVKKKFPEVLTGECTSRFNPSPSNSDAQSIYNLISFSPILLYNFWLDKLFDNSNVNFSFIWNICHIH